MLDSCDISDSSENNDSSDNGDSSDNSDRRQEQTCLQYFSTVCISNMHVGHGSVPCWPLFLKIPFTLS